MNTVLKYVGGQHLCSYIRITGHFFHRAKYFRFIMRKVISKVYNVVLQFTECEMQILRKQISECERRILECENRYWSAKALPKASRRIFSPEITAGNFFCKVFLPPPPIKIKWSLPYKILIECCLLLLLTWTCVAWRIFHTKSKRLKRRDCSRANWRR